MLLKVADLLEQRSQPLMGLIMREAGKSAPKILSSASRLLTILDATRLCRAAARRNPLMARARDVEREVPRTRLASRAAKIDCTSRAGFPYSSPRRAFW